MIDHIYLTNMASSIGSSLVYRDVLTIRPFSDLKQYEKVRVLGSGGFGKVYLLRLRDTEETRKENEEQFAGKVQCFDGGPSLNRREAAIMTKLKNLEVWMQFRFHVKTYKGILLCCSLNCTRLHNKIVLFS